MKRVPHKSRLISKLAAVIGAAALALAGGTAQASIAYGSINNFDTVNDTGGECHGFEIEIEDCHSTDVTYTYNYNHYGVPKITEDNSVAGHPKTVIRWESKKNADGSWAAYTAIPAGPISPTNGHMFTNPAVNFGGEHFGVGYRVPATTVRYNWLIDNGAGVLVHGGAVQVSTPVFTYYPPAPAQPLPQVQAVIVPPPPPAPPVMQFGKAMWVKDIKTTTHNAKKMNLVDLRDPDPANPAAKNWANGEPAEVETEWRILQTEFGNAGNPKGELKGLPQDLPGGNEVVTRRYEFYKYVGPLDAETGEAMGDAVGPDGIHGAGTVTYADHFDPALGEWVKVTVNMSNKIVVGDFTGAQMAAVEVDAAVGLIEHVSDGKVNTPYAARTIVVQGSRPFTATRTGSLPPGMTFNAVTGALSGTPTVSGQFTFKVTASDAANPGVAKNYTLTVAAAGAALPPASLIDTTASPVNGGTTTGDGSYAPGSNVTVNATANAGFRFVNWTDSGQVVSNAASYTFAIDVNHSLVANFTLDVPQRNIITSASPATDGGTSGGGVKDDGSTVTVVATPNAGYTFANWTEAGAQVSAAASYTFTATADRALVANFTAAPSYTVATGATPTAGGTTTGDGLYFSGANATVVALANAGYTFANWTVGGTPASTSPSYTFAVTTNRTLSANFVVQGTQKTILTSASPTAGGTTSGGGSYAAGDSATIVATANPGYIFSKWQEAGSGTASTLASYTFTVAGNRTLVASFDRLFSITASASPIVGGRTEMDSLIYKVGDNAQARAFPAAGYNFANWTENGVVVSTLIRYSFRVNRDRVLVANFTSNTGVTITTSSVPAAGGVTAGAGTYVAGDSVTISATTNAGYVFVNWTENGVEASTSPNYPFTASAHRTLVANFVAGYQISTGASPADGGSTTGGGIFNSGSSVTVTATSNAGYSFTNWTEGGTGVSNSLSYTFNAAADRSVVANFSAIPPAVPVNVSPGSNATSVSATPVLQASAFSGAAPGVTHAASQWIVRRVSDGIVVFDSGTDTTHLTSVQVPVALDYSTSFQWQVQYEDNRGAWSGFSGATGFSTQQKPVSSFLRFRGAYAGLIQSGEPRLCGIASVTLAANGGYSASLNINGKVYPATGVVNPDGTFVMTIVRAGLPSLSVSLVLDTTDSSDQMTGSVSDGVVGAVVLLNRRVYSTANPVPANLVGAYTFLLPPDPAHTGPTAPQGYGYGTLTLNATGGIAFTVVLGDGTKVTRSTFLSKTATMPFYVPTYVDGGSAIGWLTFRDTANASDIDGTLVWNKLPVAIPVASTKYPAGFSLQTSAVGSKYTAPSAGVRAIALADKVGNATIDFSSGNLVRPMPTQTITLNANNLVTSALGSNVTMTLTLATGLFTGTFTLPGAANPISFAGALFQKQDAAGFGDAAGLFTSRLQTGSMVLKPVP